jgi:hypothetical protein
MMRHQVVLTIGLIVMIAGLPLVALAQTGGTTTPPPMSPGLSPPPPAGGSTGQAPSASPARPGTQGTQRGETPSGMAFPRTPMIQADCSKGRWQQYGFPDEAACVRALPASPPSTR